MTLHTASHCLGDPSHCTRLFSSKYRTHCNPLPSNSTDIHVQCTLHTVYFALHSVSQCTVQCTADYINFTVQSTHMTVTASTGSYSFIYSLLPLGRIGKSLSQICSYSLKIGLGALIPNAGVLLRLCQWDTCNQGYQLVSWD